jgi:hypothetical protein
MCKFGTSGFSRYGSSAQLENGHMCLFSAPALFYNASLDLFANYFIKEIFRIIMIKTSSYEIRKYQRNCRRKFL